MNNFIAIFSMFGSMFALMAIGIMFKRKPIAGSCGGLGGVGVEKACDCDDPCDKKKGEQAALEQTITFEQLEK